MKKEVFFILAIFTIVGIASGSDFSIEGVTLTNGRTLEQGIEATPATNIQDINDAFLVTVLWNRIAPPAGRGQHFIEAHSVVTGDQINRAFSVPTRFSNENADAAGRITIRVPFLIPWRKIAEMTRDRHIAIEFSMNISPAGHDDNAANNTRTFSLRVINAPTPNDFIAEIVPGSLHTKVHNVPFNRKFDRLEYRVNTRFTNRAYNDAGGPASPVPGVFYWIEFSYMADNGQWHRFGYDCGNITVPANGWVTVRTNRDGGHLWEGVNAIPVNQWKPLRITVSIDMVGTQEFYDHNRANNTAETTFNLH
jgi:hypothetical protein